MIEKILSLYPNQFRTLSCPKEVLHEAKNRVLDTFGCFYGAFNSKPAVLLRKTLAQKTTGECRLWGTAKRVPPELAAWLNGTAVRALDYNDTYLSKEPCHPSDLISSLWAACEIGGSQKQGRLLLEGIVLGYEVLCQLCDANSLRVRGWDHVTYLPIASAVASSYILGLTPEQARHAISLSIVGNNAMRQTRVGSISDWKASCAAYAARSGLWTSRLAQNGFTGPNDIFSGRNGFFNQVSGPFSLPKNLNGKKWKIMSTHVKYFPAEHHAQSAIEAAVSLRTRRVKQSLLQENGSLSSEIATSRKTLLAMTQEIVIECFDVAVQIIGSEKEKWQPTTRETADHSMPYLVVAALLDGDINLNQFESGRYKDSDVKSLLKKVKVTSSKKYTALYPKFMPSRVTIKMKSGETFSQEILRPKGYAGRPMSEREIQRKFVGLASSHLSQSQMDLFIKRTQHLENVSKLSTLL